MAIRSAVKLHLVTSLFSLLFICPCFGQDIKFDNTSFDLGRVNQGSIIEWTVNYVNTGDSTLALYNLKSTGGGQVAYFVDNKRMIDPYDTGAIIIKYHITQLPGSRFNKIIIVESNAKNADKVTLSIEGEVANTEAD